MWHVGSRSGVATLRTAIHLLLTSLLTLTSPAAGHHRPLTGTELYRLVTDAHVCEQLALKRRGRESNPQPSQSLAMFCLRLLYQQTRIDTIYQQQQSQHRRKL